MYVCTLYINISVKETKKFYLHAKMSQLIFAILLRLPCTLHKCVHLDPAQAGSDKAKTLRCMRQLVCCINVGTIKVFFCKPRILIHILHIQQEQKKQEK